MLTGTPTKGIAASRQARCDGRGHLVVADEQAVADPCHIAAAQRPDEGVCGVAAPAPHAGRQHQFVAHQVGGGVRELGDVDPADRAVEVTVDE